MRIKCSSAMRAILVFTLILSLTIAATQMRADTGTCGGQSTTLPFTDVPSTNIFFCSIAEAYFTGLTNGTSSTTYSPSANVPREQMAAFITRTLDQSLKRGNRRTALNQRWIPQSTTQMGFTSVGDDPSGVQSDGADIWVANSQSHNVSRVRGSDGRLLETWTGATNARGVLVAMGYVFVTGPGNLYRINPRQTAGAVTTLTSALGANSGQMAFDGTKIWTANSAGGSVSYVTPQPSIPWFPTTVTTGFSQPVGILYDGTNIWITDSGDDSLKKLNSNGDIIQTIPMGAAPRQPAFDGLNIWVPTNASSVKVVRVRDVQAFVLATLTGNGLLAPTSAAFDGERMLILDPFADAVSLWKATDLTPLGFVSTGGGTFPDSACSDGLNFWITLSGTDGLLRF